MLSQKTTSYSCKSLQYAVLHRSTIMSIYSYGFCWFTRTWEQRDDLSPSIYVSLKCYLTLKIIRNLFSAQHCRKISIIRFFDRKLTIAYIWSLYQTRTWIMKISNVITWLFAVEKQNYHIARYPQLFGALNRKPCVWHQQTEWRMWGNLSHMSQLGSGTAENRLLTVDFLTVWFQLLRKKC